MSRQGEMKDKYDKIRELQEQRDRREREARSQSDDLDAILEASREAHDIPLVSSSKLSGPGFGTMPRATSAASPEDAYASNFERSKYASPEAFKRTRNNPTVIPDGSIGGLQQRTLATPAPGQARDSDAPQVNRHEPTVTMTVRAQAPSPAPTKSEVTQVVRKRTAALGNRPRREPAAVAPTNLTYPPEVDGPALQVPPKALPQLPVAEAEPQAVPERQRVTFTRPQATPATSRMVTNRPANYGTLPFRGSATMTTHDTTPFGSDTRRMVMRGPGFPDDTSPGDVGDSTSPGLGDSTSPGGPEHDTSPGAGDTPAPFEQTSPGTFPGTAPGTPPVARSVPQPPPPDDESDPFWRDDVDFEPVPVAPALHSPPEPTPTATVPAIPVQAKADEPQAAAPKATEPESTENDARYKRVREIDALIARFAADVEVKVGQGRDNTFLRKRSEILPPDQRSSGAFPERDDDFPDERTQPRHRNIEVRRENTEIIPRRLPPRKRK